MTAEEFWQSKNGGKSSHDATNHEENITPIYAVRLMEQYKNEQLKEFGEGIARMIQYNTGNTVAQIKEAIRRFQNGE